MGPAAHLLSVWWTGLSKVAASDPIRMDPASLPLATWQPTPRLAVKSNDVICHGTTGSRRQRDVRWGHGP